MRLFILLPLCLLLAACWQVKDPVVAQGRRVDGLADGLYRRSDGSEIMIRWNPAQGRYDVGMTGGSARAAPLGGGLWLVDYADAVRLVLVAGIRDGAIVVHAPSPDVEARLAKAHGLTLKPGPVLILGGPPQAVHALAADVAALAGSPDLAEAERLIKVR